MEKKDSSSSIKETKIHSSKKQSSNYIYREDLVKPKNLKMVFKQIRNYLAGNLKGTTRDEKLAEQLIFLLFCKIEDELTTPVGNPTRFQLNHPDGTGIRVRLTSLFNQIKSKYPTVFDSNDTVLIDANVVKDLQHFCITEASRDSISDVFEVFIGPSLRGNKGQFFTPKNVVKTMVKIINPKFGETIIDPACGSGGFLIEAFSYIIENNDYSKNKNNESNQLTLSITGIDKDCFLAKIARIYLMILGLQKNSVFCDNSLESPEKWHGDLKTAVALGTFDIVLTNPPFGSKIPITDDELLKQYSLGHKWKKTSHGWSINNKKIQDKQPPQILFIERCLNLLKPGGRMGIVLPEGIFGNPSDRYILEFILRKAKILAVISCSPLTFLPHTHTKTSILFLEKATNKSLQDYEFFMAIAENVGHDKNGKVSYKMDNAGNYLLDENGEKIINDDFPEIVNRYRRFLDGKSLVHSHLGFSMNFSDIKDKILIPDYYNPEIEEELEDLERSGKFELIPIRELINSGTITIRRGHEIGSRFYGTGDIPFVRTSDLINWEINIDPKKQVSEEIYLQYKDKQDIQPGDILFVSDGTFLIGTSAMVTEKDTKIIIQSHLKKIRVLNKSLLNEYILLWALNTNIVQKQIKAKTFIQSTISTIGDRLEEVILPLPQDNNLKNQITTEIKEIIRDKMYLKQRMKKAIQLIDKI